MLFNFVDERFAGFDDALFVLEKFARFFRGEEIKIGFANGIVGIRKSETFRERPADFHKPRLRVLEINPVRDVFQHRLDQHLGVDERAIGLG